MSWRVPEGMAAAVAAIVGNAPPRADIPDPADHDGSPDRNRETAHVIKCSKFR
jgi:hypothetical protein